MESTIADKEKEIANIEAHRKYNAPGGLSLEKEYEGAKKLLEPYTESGWKVDTANSDTSTEEKLSAPITNPPVKGLTSHSLKAFLHHPKVVVSSDHTGTGKLDKLATLVSNFIGNMWVFVGATILIVIWLFAGNLVGFDKTPWVLLLTILNLPQLSIMISLQVSANLNQRVSDARALTDHETLHAVHELNKHQVEMLAAQQEMLQAIKEDGGHRHNFSCPLTPND